LARAVKPTAARRGAGDRHAGHPHPQTTSVRRAAG
jgi:hypothetical protein